MMQSPVITINSRKYDLSIRRSWQARLIEQKADLLLFVGEFAEDVHHPDLGHIQAGTISYEYYWLDRWYNVFRFHHPDGTFRNWYCNVTMPPTFDGAILDYVDLDIDILVWPGKHPIILDEDEFKENAARYAYAENVVRQGEAAVDGLLKMLRSGEFPFNSLEPASA